MVARTARLYLPVLPIADSVRCSGLASCAAADVHDAVHGCRLPYGVLQRRWFTNAADGNTITMASGLGGLIYITTAWVSHQGVHVLWPVLATCLTPWQV